MESKLMNVRCDNCGAEYRISSRGEMICRFCGSKIYLTDRDFSSYKNTRDEMLLSDRFTNDELESDGDILGLWQSSSPVNFTTLTGANVSFDSFYSVLLDHKEVYIGSNKIAAVFSDKRDARIFCDSLAQIMYPSADIKDLSRYLPNITYKADLDDGRFLMLISKAENIYPLFLFSDLKATTVAWMISRFENLGCLLEFNDMDIDSISIEEIYINPKTHELFILDGWENAAKTSRRNYLKDIRRISLSVMDRSSAPELCIKFLEGAPAMTAYDDFKNWDDVIMNGFNGHNFHKFNT